MNFYDLRKYIVLVLFINFVFTIKCMGNCEVVSGEDPVNFIPLDSEAIFIVNKLGDFRDHFVRTLSNLKTSEGIFKAIEIYTGLDFQSDKHLKENGFDPKRSASVFIKEGVIFAVCGAYKEKKLDLTISERLRRIGFKKNADNEPYVRTGGTEKVSYRFTNGVFILAYSFDTSDTEKTLNTLLSASNTSELHPSVRKPFSTIYIYANLRKLLSNSNIFNLFGTLAFPLSIISSYHEEIKGVVNFKDKLIELSFQSNIKNPFADNIGIEESKESSIPLFISVNLPVSSINDVPKLIKKMIFQDAFLETIHPILKATTFEDIFKKLTGKMNLGISGLSDKFELIDLRKGKINVQQIFSMFDTFISFQLKEQVKLFENLPELNLKLAQTGWAVEPVNLDPSNPVFVLKANSGEKLFLMVSGNWLIATSEKTVTSFAEKKSLYINENIKSNILIRFMPARIVKQLSRKGFFPYFLSIINDIEMLETDFIADKGEANFKTIIKFR